VTLLRRRTSISVGLCAALAALLLAAPSARALPLPSGLEGSCSFTGCDAAYWAPGDGGNGHYYAFVPTGTTPVSWTAARDAAANSSLGPGTVGHLATIADATENGFIVNEILPLPATLSKRQVWLGGFQNDTPVKSLPPDVGWQWISPESWVFTDWAPGEANDEGVAGGDERYLTMWVHYFIAGVDNRGTWNDENLDSQPQGPSLGFIVEYEARAVPEPGTVLLALLGTALLARRSRRSRR
jgi:hypothetical protein